MRSGTSSSLLHHYSTLANITPTPSYSNTVQSLQAILDALPTLNLSILPQSYDAAGLIEELDPQERSADPAIRNAMMTVWHDPAVRQAMGMSYWLRKIWIVVLTLRDSFCGYQFTEQSSSSMIQLVSMIVLNFDHNALVLTFSCITAYFFDSIERVTASNYRPTDQDM